MTYIKKLLVLILLGASSIACAEQSPSQVVAEFYHWAMHPAENELAMPDFDPVRPLVGKALLRALETQRAYQHACTRVAAAGDKPHMIDQNIFFLAADGAKTLDATVQTITGNVARVSINFSDDDIHWTDTVLMQIEGARWVVIDIDWQDGESLTKRLADFANDKCAPQ